MRSTTLQLAFIAIIGISFTDARQQQHDIGKMNYIYTQYNFKEKTRDAYNFFFFFIRYPLIKKQKRNNGLVSAYYIHPCQKANPNVNECLTYSANHLAMHFRKGE